jgi:NodT family efflux transporter outer membrane factor (OMF) lipoprotein
MLQTRTYDLKSMLLLMAAAWLSGCGTWQPYTRPALDIPQDYKENFSGWMRYSPDKHTTQDDWWTSYEDLALEALLKASAEKNPSVQLATAQYEQAAALVKSSESARFPAITASASALRNKRSVNANNVNQNNNQQKPFNIYSLGLAASWELDVWGRIRNSIAVSEANLSASQADLAAVKLSTQTTLAQQYFQIRILDTQLQILNDNILAFEKTLKLTQNRYAVGLVSKADVSQAESQVRITKAQVASNKIQRAQLEHAIAVLVGQAPASFSIEPRPYRDLTQVYIPEVASSLPSSLLERRPDIIAAEQRLYAANAQIGIAKTALFPTVSLSANLGGQSTLLADLFAVPSRVWAFGPTLAAIIFDGGQRKALTDAAIANHDAVSATYKQAVLTGFQEVEDQLVALKYLEQQYAEQNLAVRYAKDALDKTVNAYNAGTIDYTAVTVVQTNTLSNQLALLSTLSQRLVASVGLVKALGGPIKH